MIEKARAENPGSFILEAINGGDLEAKNEVRGEWGRWSRIQMYQMLQLSSTHVRRLVMGRMWAWVVGEWVDGWEKGGVCEMMIMIHLNSHVLGILKRPHANSNQLRYPLES